jgi:flagellar protein FlaI
MEREVKRRIDILEYMKRIGVENYRQVAKIVSAYYKEPDKVIEEVRAKLSE